MYCNSSLPAAKMSASQKSKNFQLEFERTRSQTSLPMCLSCDAIISRYALKARRVRKITKLAWFELFDLALLIYYRTLLHALRTGLQAVHRSLPKVAAHHVGRTHGVGSTIFITFATKVVVKSLGAGGF